MKPRELIALAREASEESYAPYSHFHVGAALLLSDGSVVTGTNVENRSYGLTNCAERTAIFTAIAAGRRDFAALAICCPDADYPVSPCGACRQVISEFTKPAFPIYFAGGKGVTIETTTGDLFPHDALRELAD